MQHSLSLSVAQTGATTMSSREIAELTDKRHDNVMRDIRSMLSEIGEDPLKFEETGLDSYGRPQSIYALNREMTELLLTGYSVPLRHKVLSRLRELESGKFQVPTTLSGALRLAAEQAETIELQAAQIARAAPKVEFVNKYVAADSGSIGLRQVCKLLGAKQNEFIAFLVARQFMYRTTPKSPLQPRAEHMHTGRFEAKTGVAEHAETSHAFVHYKFTPKGFEWIAGEWAKFKVREMVEYDNQLM